MTVAEIVTAYIQHHRMNARDEMLIFKNRPSLACAIHRAALCLKPNGKRHSHQRQSGALLQAAEHQLQNTSSKLGAATDFEALHRVVDMEIGAMRGIGELAVYDIAHRIGAFLGKSPILVYLHRGTLEGARALGFSGKTLDPSRLPSTFSRLTPAEIEDCLCIYKAELRGGELRTGILQQPSHCIGSNEKHFRTC